MKAGNIEILDLDFEYKLWKNRLLFYSHEIEYLFDRMDVLKREKPSFYIEEELIGKLRNQQQSILLIKNRIRTLEQEIAFYAEDYPINSEHQHFINHEIIREGIKKIVDREEEIISELYPQLCYPLEVVPSP